MPNDDAKIGADLPEKKPPAGGDAFKTDVIRSSDIQRAVNKMAPEHPGAKSLDELIAEAGGGLPPALVVDIAKQIASELDLAWTPETFLDNLRPSAIVVWGDERKLVAFSSTRMKTAVRKPEVEAQFVPPEMVASGTADGRGDIFAFGVILCYMLTGSYPFSGADADAINRSKVAGTPMRMSTYSSDIPPELDDFVSGMLAPAPAFRYPNPAEVLRDLGLLGKAQAEDLLLHPNEETDAMEVDLLGKSALIEKPVVTSPRERHAATPGAEPTDVFQKPVQTPGAVAVDGAGGAPPVPAAGEAKPARVNLGVLIGAGGGVLALIIVMAALMSSTAEPGGTGSDVAGADAAALPAGGAASSLEDEARTLHAQAVEMVNGGDLDGATKSLTLADRRYGQTAFAPKFAALRGIVEQRREAERIEAEREAQKRAATRLEDEGLEFVAVLRGEFERGNFEHVITKVDALGAQYAATTSGPAIAALKQDATAKTRSAAQREAEDKRRQQGAELLALAERQVHARQFERAADSIARARAAGAVEEADRLVKLIEHEKLVVLGERAVAEGKLKDASLLYNRALEIQPVRRTQTALADVERRIRLAETLGRAQELARKPDTDGALAAYREARSLALAEGVAEIDAVIASIEAQRQIQKHIVTAETALKDQRWFDAVESASAVLAIVPEHENARWILKGARQKIGPDRQVSGPFGLTLALVPAGEFTMGCVDGDVDEAPVRTVYLDAFYMSVCEITNVQYEQFDPAHIALRKKYSDGDGTPVVLVTWDDARRFCDWLTEKEGVEYRLPTEAQFEKAARGTDGRRYPWGDELPGEQSEWQCNVAQGRDEAAWSNDGHRYAAPVGSYAAYQSPLGIHDLSGNVWEWCRDWYSGAYYATREANNPVGPAIGRQRVLRGGSFANTARAARASNRTAKPPEYREASVGFRVVRALDAIFTE